MNAPVDFDKYVGDYNALLNERTRFFSPSEEYFARYKVEVVRSSGVSSPRRILEYGCGIGRNIPFLQQAFPRAEIVGTDISAESLEFARREYGGARFLVEGTETAGIGSFDMVFVAGVFHHIPVAHRDEAGRVIFERMQPGGELFVFEHNPFNPVTRRIVSRCEYDADAVLLRPRELRHRLAQVGFSIVESAYCLFVPPALGWVVKCERFLRRVPLGGQYWVHARKVSGGNQVLAIS